MSKSAGIVLFRRKDQLEIFLVHPGGPYFTNKDEGHWSIPKGGVESGETNLQAGIRELWEETSIDLNSQNEDKFIDLGEIRYPSGKRIHVFAYEYLEEIDFKSITTWIEFPYKSGKELEIPENDKGGWFTLDEAEKKLTKNQKVLTIKITESL